MVWLISASSKYATAPKKAWSNLLHEPSLAITIRVLHGVQLIEQAGFVGRSSRSVVDVVVVASSGSRTAAQASLVIVSMVRVHPILFRHRRRTVRTMTTDRVAMLVPGRTIERIVARLGATKGAAGLLELGHGHGWEGAGGVVLGLVVVDLVDRLGRVDNVALDGLLLDDWLDVLVDVVVHMLASERGSLGVSVPGTKC